MPSNILEGTEGGPIFCTAPRKASTNQASLSQVPCCLGIHNSGFQNLLVYGRLAARELELDILIRPAVAAGIGTRGSAGSCNLSNMPSVISALEMHSRGLSHHCSAVAGCAGEMAFVP